MFSLPCTLDAITAIVNKSITTGTVPSQWKTSIVTPIPKINDPVELKDLRPISILPFLSKLLERVICDQLTSYVEANDILPPLQSGFRKGRGTVTALLDVTDNVLAEQDRGRCTLLTLLDYSRAFDCLNIPLLLAKLSYYGLSPLSITWFESYLNNRSQAVKLVKSDGSTLSSQPMPIVRGVPQGSILGPLLFIIYCADLHKVIRNSNHHCYADDVQVYISETPGQLANAVQRLNMDLNAIADWSSRNALVLNPTKSQYMVLGTKSQIDKLNGDPDVTIQDSKVFRVEEARNLGIIIDSHLRFENHVINLVKTCFYRLKVLYKIRNQLSEASRIILCESLIVSKLNYGDIVFGPRLLERTQRTVQRVQNACCRFCFNIPPRSHITPFLNNMSLLNMESRRLLHLGGLVFDVIKFRKPEYLHSKLNFVCDNWSLRSVRSALLYHNHKTAAFRGSFRYSATKCWNNIPPPIRNVKTKYSFKIHFKKFLLQKQIEGIPKHFVCRK